MGKPFIKTILLSVLLSLPPHVYGEDDIDIILNKLVHKSNSPIDKELSMLDERSGSFRDINYADPSRVYWMPLRHLERINHFSEVYINPINQYYRSDYLYNIIVKGLEFWINLNPYCNNWWFNEIAVPQQIGLILLNMRSPDAFKIPTVLENELINKMENSVKNPRYFTGANRTDIVTHWIYRACLNRNDTELRRAANLIFEPLRYSLSEGITIDNSYLQHGRQLYIGGYAIRFLESITGIAYLFKDTKYALSNDKLIILSKFARDTFFRSIRGQCFSFNVVGRSISRKGALNETSRVIPIARRLMELDPQHQNEYENIIKRLSGKVVPSSFIDTLYIHYYYSDYSLYTCPLYTFDVRFSSSRTRKCESLNNENLKGYFLSEGSHCLLMSGNEYNGLFPVWNWTRIPGVTAPQIEDIPRVKDGDFGTSGLAGGVSDSIVGVTAYAVNDTSLCVSAKKSWFFLGHEIVCLGSDINSILNKRFESSINQCFGGDCKSVSYCLGDSIYKLHSTSDSLLRNPKWVYYNNIGYLFNKDQNVIISKGKQYGNWYQINKAFDKSIVDKEVFYLGIDHGICPKDGHYSYRIVPGIDSESQLQSYIKNSEINIIEKHNIHAVYNASEDILFAVFYENGTFIQDDITISVNKPCVTLLKGLQTKIHPSLHIANLAEGVETIIFNMSSRSFRSTVEIDCNKYDMKYGKTAMFIL